MKKSSKIILALIVIMLLVAMVVGGYFLVKISKESKEKISSLENEIETLKGEKENSNTQDKNELSSDTKNEDKPVASKNEDSSNKKSETEIANEAIRKALKDEAWITENIYGTYKSTYEGMYEGNWYNEAKKELVFAKVADKENSMPLYIVGTNSFPAGSDFFYLVQYKNGKVVSEWIPEPDYGWATFDLNNGIVRSVPDVDDSLDVPYYIKIKNGVLVQVIDESESNSDRIYFNDIECIKVDLKDFDKKYSFKIIETKLTDENIDKYVK